MKLRCFIIDDEPLARKGLAEYVAEIDFLELTGQFEHPMAALPALQQTPPDLLLLDIQMPGITGIEWLKTLPHPPMVIFTTAYPQHAVAGFEVNALDYLVKPISFERFLKGANKAREQYALQQLAAANAGARQAGSHFYIKHNNKLVNIQLSDITWVEALQNYVCLHTTHQQYITYLTFKSIEDFLPANRFVKVHKSFLVAADKVTAIEGNMVHIGSAIIPISRSFKEQAIERLTGGRLLKRE